ncbi:hypothetical protein ACFRFH_10470 [Leifsonia sp. NPDC056824]
MAEFANHIPSGAMPLASDQGVKTALSDRRLTCRRNVTNRGNPPRDFRD